MGNGQIKQILMDRDGVTEQEADELIQDAKQALLAYIDANDFNGAENVCEEYFGLEPDYIMELL